jgi:prepilin-type N-terminal cleavage/methylation domain-containing protein
MLSTACGSHQPRLARRAPSAFTLIELLIVIGIIALLLVLALAVGRSVTNSGRARQTEYTLKVLDAALSEYIHSQETMPPPWVVDPRSPTTGVKTVHPVVDGVWDGGSGARPIDAMALFMLQCSGIPNVEAKFRDLDSKLVREVELDLPGLSGTFRLTTVLDGWGRPIRYVHPAFSGEIGTASAFATVTEFVQLPGMPSQYRFGINDIRRHRDSRDADGGVPPASRPYFYSAGPDGDPATVDDNIYLTRPQIQRN